MFGRSKADTRNEQKMFDKLDNLNILSQETRDTVRDLNNKLDAHAERLARVESDVRTLYKRVERIEGTCDAYLIHRPEGTD